MRRGLSAAAIVVAAAVVALLAVPALAEPQATAVTGTVGPGFTIGVTKAGKAVKTLKAGAYTFTINDKAPFHNFRLTGPGVNKATGVAKQGKTKWNVTLKPGTYRFLCDPHRTTMKGSFKVAR